MKFFSKFVFICNACFLIAVVLRFVEFGVSSAISNNTNAIKFQPLESTIVVLGYGAILVNFIFLLFCAFSGIFKITIQVPSWMKIISAVFFIIQVVYFFI
jgi:hypothetical protein